MLALILFCGAVGMALAQTFGTITGDVTDATAAVVPGATVTIRNVDTNATRTVMTNADGLYSVPLLPPGIYDIRVEKEGFRGAARSAMELQVQQTARVDFTLAVGQVSETLDVAGQAALLNTEDATVGTVIEEKRIVELPLNGRNFLQLVSLSPNVTSGFSSQGQATVRQGGDRANQNMAIAGARASWNYYTLDGVTNTDPNFNTYLVLPDVDMLQEFKVQSGIYPAEFGHAASQINVSTKGGTNQYHGGLYEFVRNDKFDANQSYAFSAADHNLPKTPFQWNQYGFTLGGPIQVPKVFNGKDRLLFASNFERFRQVTRPTAVYSVASMPMRNGDFSALNTSIWDPVGRSLAADGKTILATPFANNVIPMTRMSLQAAKLYEFEPLPNSPSESAANAVPLRNFRETQHGFSNKDQFHIRPDWVESPKSAWFGRFSWTDEALFNPGLYLSGTQTVVNAKQAMLSNTRTLSPTVVNEFRFGANVIHNANIGELAFKRNVMGELNIPNVPPPVPAAWGVPAVTNLGTTSTWGGGADPYTNQDAAFQWVDNVSIVRGKHAFRMGADIRRDRYNYNGGQFLDPSMEFNGQNTRNPNTNAGGANLADFFLGYMSTVRYAVAPAFGQLRSTTQAYYFQDTWRVSPKLTIDAGLRYEYMEPYVDRAGRLTSVQVPALIYGVVNLPSNLHEVFVRSAKGDFYQDLPFRFGGTTLNGAYVPVQVARDGRMGDGLMNPDRTNFAPRLGIAWSPSSKWTVRAGAGIFYSMEVGNVRFDMARNLTGKLQTVGPTNFPVVTIANFISVDPSTGLVQPAGSIPQLTIPQLWSNAQNTRNSFTFQYLLNIQRELTNSTVVEVGYIGSQIRHLWGIYDSNQPITAADGSAPNTRAPNPELGINMYTDTDGRGNYNGVSGKLTRRFAQGLTALVGYTFSKSIDTGSAWRGQGDAVVANDATCIIQCERGLSSYDVPQRLVASVLYELPFGRGKRFQTSWGGIPNQIFGGWQISSIITFQSGLVQNFSGARNSLTLQDGARPNATGQPLKLDHPRTGEWFNTAAVVIPPQGVVGNVGRDVIRGPGQQYWDFATHKSFRVREGHTLTFRFEAFNFANHPALGRPTASVGTTTTLPATFGTITTVQVPMRQIQLGLKYAF
jgi:hypothetical protein